MNKKHVCVVTGTRAEYNYLKLIIQKIINSEKLKLSLLITGMHLLKKYGHTIDIIIKDNFPITEKIPMYDENDLSEKSMGRAVGRAIIHFTEAFYKYKPDILLVLGDRLEPLAAVISASTLSIPIAHIHGGDITGSIDENIRHAITKLSHIHFPATKKSYERIKLLGENPDHIFNVGSPTIDNILKERRLNKKDIFEKFNLNPDKKSCLCIQHPDVFKADKAGEYMKITLQVLKDLDLQVIIIYPNNDYGSQLIIKEIEDNAAHKKFRIYKNLERNDYLSLFENVDVLIGNSSSGLIESPIFHLPVVNIGDRNKGRETAENVIDVPYDYVKIKNAVIKALSYEFKKFCETVENPYGKGDASDKIIKILEELAVNEDLLIKKLTYEV
ncbi:MAG: UDP-N-acetylglucosamine 2-epimerase [Promethearchaeota archaeon]